MNNWVGVLGTLGGVILGGLIAYITNARQMTQQKQLVLSQRQIENLEKAHEVLTQIGVLFRYLHSSCSFLIVGGMRKEENSERVPFEELEMLFSFYIPSLEIDAKQLIEVCQEFGAAVVKAKVWTPEDDADKKKLWDELCTDYRLIESRIRELKSKLAKIIWTYMA